MSYEINRKYVGPYTTPNRRESASCGVFLRGGGWTPLDKASQTRFSRSPRSARKASERENGWWVAYGSNSKYTVYTSHSANIDTDYRISVVPPGEWNYKTTRKYFDRVRWLVNLVSWLTFRHCPELVSGFPLFYWHKARTFQDPSDFTGRGIFKKKNPGLSRRRGNPGPVVCKII